MICSVRSLGVVVASVLGLALAGCGGAAPASAPASVAPAASVPGASAAAGASAAGKPSGQSGESAAGKPSAAAQASGQSGGTPLTVAYSELTATHATLWGAKDWGIFDANGLNVDVRLIESSLGVGALLSGQVQIGSMGGSEMLAADVNGADLVMYALISPVYPYKFEAQPGIKTPADLKGKKIGISRFGSSSDTATRAWFKTVGLDADKDVTIVQIGSLAARVAALKTGALDGAVCGTTDAAQVEAAGLHPLVDLAAAKIPAVNDGIIAQRAWVEANHDTMQKFIDSIMEAKPREKADKPRTLALIKKWLKDDDPAKAEVSYEYFVDTVIPDAPYPPAQNFKDALDVLAAQNPKAKGFDVSKVVDPSFVQSAVNRGIGKS